MAALADANVTLCDPSDLTAYLTQDKIDFSWNPLIPLFFEVSELKDVEMKSEEVDIFIEGKKKTQKPVLPGTLKTYTGGNGRWKENLGILKIYKPNG